MHHWGYFSWGINLQGIDMNNKNILTLLLTMISLTSFGQNNDVWTAFWNSDTTLIGFKDKHGEIKIAPRFAGITIAEKFENPF